MQSARNGYTLDDRRFYWPHIVTFPPKGRITELLDIPAVAQRMYDRVSRLSALPAAGSAAAGPHRVPPVSTTHIHTETDTLTDTGREEKKKEMDQKESALCDVRLSWKADEAVVLLVMQALSAHFPISQPGQSLLQAESETATVTQFINHQSVELFVCFVLFISVCQSVLTSMP